MPAASTVMRGPALAVIGSDGQLERSTAAFSSQLDAHALLEEHASELEPVLRGEVGSTVLNVGGVTAAVEVVADASGARHALLTLRGEGKAAAGTPPANPLLDEDLDSSPAIIFLKDLEGRYLRVNAAHGQIVGVGEALLQGRADRELPPRQTVDGPRLAERDPALPEPLQLEYIVPAFEGRPALSVLRFLVHDAAGEPVALCGVATPVSEAHVAQAEAERLLDLTRLAHLGPSEARAELLGQWGLVSGDEAAEALSRTHRPPVPEDEADIPAAPRANRRTAPEPADAGIRSDDDAADAELRAEQARVHAEQAHAESQHLRSELEMAHAETEQARAIARREREDAETARSTAQAARSEAAQALLKIEQLEAGSLQLSSRFEQAEAEARESRVRAERADDDAATARARAEQAEANARTAQARADEAEAAARQAELRAEQVSAEAERGATRATQSEEDAKQARARAEQAEADARQARAQAAQAETDARQARLQIEQAETEARRAKAEAAELEGAARQAQERAQELEAGERQARIQIESLESAVRQARAQVEDLELAAARSKAITEEAEATARQSRARAEQAEAELQALRTQAQTPAASPAESGGKSADSELRQRLRAAEAERDGAGTQATELRESLAGERARTDELRRSLTQAQERLAELAGELETARTAQAVGIETARAELAVELERLRRAAAEETARAAAEVAALRAEHAAELARFQGEAAVAAREQALAAEHARETAEAAAAERERQEAAAAEQALAEAEAAKPTGKSGHGRGAAAETTTGVGWTARAQHELAGSLGDLGDLRTGFTRAASVLGRRGGWDLVACWLPDPRGLLRCGGSWSSDALSALEDQTTRSAQSVGGSALGRALYAREPVAVTLGAAGDDGDERLAQAFAGGVRTALHVPIRDGVARIGVLELLSTGPSAPEEDVVAALEAVGLQLGQFAALMRARRSTHESTLR